MCTDYPDKCIRGISDPGCVFKVEESVHLQITLFDFHGAPEDGWIAESINWMDDNHAVAFTLGQRKEGTEDLQFKVGVAILSRCELDALKRRQGIGDYFDYERDRIQGNEYHGNLLLKDGVGGRPFKTKVRSLLAFQAVSQVILQKDYAVGR